MKLKVQKSITLLEALIQLAPESSKSKAKSWLKQKRVAIDGKICQKADFLLTPGQEVFLIRKKRLIGGGVDVLYEDNHIVVAYKPRGLLSVAAHFEEQETLHGFLKNKYKPKRVYVVHRLDQDTSGVMIFALSEEACEKLKTMFEKHTIERKYAAIVEGHLSVKKGSWKSYLFEDENYVVHSTKNPKKGRLAVTHYEVLGTSKKYSWLDLQLETGKKNQIRVHCMDAGCPVVGDKKYQAETNTVNRLCLHAYKLGFAHPITGKKMQFFSKIPYSFKKLVPEVKNFA